MFNAKLFGDTLPNCLITMQRKANCHGYFSARQFTSPNGQATTDEIAINPHYLATLGILHGLQTLHLVLQVRQEQGIHGAPEADVQIVAVAFMGGPNPHIRIPAHLMDARNVPKAAADPDQTFGHDHIQVERRHIFQHGNQTRPARRPLKWPR